MDPTDADTDSLRLEPGPARLSIFGEVDAATAPLLDDALAGAAAGAGGASELVVDCQGLAFIDSSGLNVFVVHAERLAAQGGQLVLESPPPSTRRLFEITGIDRVVTIRQ